MKIGTSGEAGVDDARMDGGGREAERDIGFGEEEISEFTLLILHPTIVRAGLNVVVSEIRKIQSVSSVDAVGERREHDDAAALAALGQQRHQQLSQQMRADHVDPELHLQPLLCRSLWRVHHPRIVDQHIETLVLLLESISKHHEQKK